MLIRRSLQLHSGSCKCHVCEEQGTALQEEAQAKRKLRRKEELAAMKAAALKHLPRPVRA